MLERPTQQELGTPFLGAKAGEANISSPENTFIGHRAGKKYIGPTAGAVGRNTFIGSQAGRDTTTGEKNTFIGTWAGRANKTGDNNIAIGVNAQLDNPTDDNQINIGNIIKAEQKTDSDDSAKKMGVLKVCNPGGDDGDGKCIELSKKSLACPADQYFRGIDENGEAICQQENFCPQSLHHWTPENICHKCPRDSPLHRPSQQPPNNCRPCASFSLYVLTGTNKNQCISNCPLSQPHYYKSRCNRCPQNRPYYDQVDQRCLRCHDNQPYFYNEKCNKCPQTQIIVNNVCQCPSATPHLYGGQCNKCRSNQVVSNGHCCNSSKPHHYGGRCNRCPQATPHYHGGRCNKCEQDQVLSNGYCCPSFYPHYSNGKCCPSDKPYYYKASTGIDIFSRGTQCNKCPKSKPALGHDGECHPCRGGYFSTDGYANCACNNPTYHWNNVSVKCVPCTERNLFRVTPEWLCEQLCDQGYYLRDRGNDNFWCCPTKDGHCCKSDHYFEDGKCKKRIGNKIIHCSEGSYVLEVPVSARFPRGLSCPPIGRLSI